jgi:hypothetical protein
MNIAMYIMSAVLVAFGVYFVYSGWYLASEARKNNGDVILGGIVSFLGIGVIVSAFALLDIFEVI